VVGGIGREDILRACLFDYEVFVGKIGSLRGLEKVGEYEGDVGNIIGEMLEKTVPLKGGVDARSLESKEQNKTGTGTREGNEGLLPL
jgi:hypothetical protein